MIHQSEKISLAHLLLLFITAVGLMEHVIILPFLFEASGRDSWLVVLISGTIFLFWLTCIYIVAKNTNQRPLYPFLTEKYGRFIATAVISVGVLYCFFICAITVYDLTRWTMITYLHGTPTIIIIVIFSFVCFYLSTTTIKTIAIVNGLLLPIIIILGFLVSFGNIPNKDYSLMFPIFEHGFAPYLKGSIYTGVGFLEVFFIIFIHHQTKTKMKLLPLYLSGLGFIMLMLGPTLGAITEFGPEGTKHLSFPAFEEWRLLSFGRFIEHLDFFAMYQWYAGAFIRISLGLYIIVEVFQIQQRQKRNLTLFMLFILLVILVQLPINSMVFHDSLKNYILPISFWVLLGFSIVVTILTVIRKEKRKVTQQ